MADAEKLTLRAPLVVVMIIFAVTATISVITIGVKVLGMIENVNTKLDVYIASNEGAKGMFEYRVSVLEKKSDKQEKRSDRNDLNIRILADMIKSDEIKLEDPEDDSR